MDMVGVLRKIATLALVLAAVAGCAEVEETDTAAADNRAMVRTAAITEAALPGMFDIMMRLQADMYRISRGLWLASPDTVARGARAVASHPRLPADEIRVIRGILGDDMTRFQALDRRVHDLAIRVAEAAEKQDMAAVVEAQRALRAGCLQCHSEFRDRLRSGIR